MPAANEDDRYYRALCICGAELPFDDETTELSCPTCQAKIAISYVAH
jgi:DNA-directed RNA polymerase subunit RPC12/RpoP